MSNVFVQESTKSSTDKAEMGGGEEVSYESQLLTKFKHMAGF